MTLHDIQTAVHVAKDKRNDFGGYNYRTAEGILAALKSALPDGTTVIVSDNIQEVAGQIFVSATATITLADGVKYHATGHAMHPLQKKGMDASQITGAASSYARKYALSGLLALDDGSADPDGDNRPAPEVKRDPRTLADSLIALIAKQSDIGTLEQMNRSYKFSAALEWLDDEAPKLATKVKGAYSERFNELDSAAYEEDAVG